MSQNEFYYVIVCNNEAEAESASFNIQMDHNISPENISVTKASTINVHTPSAYIDVPYLEDRFVVIGRT